MIGNDAPIFGRVVTAMITPFDDELNIDYPAVEKIVEHLLKTGTTAVVVSGTTGESPTLNASEKKDLLKAVVQQCKGRAKVIVGTGSNDTSKSIKDSTDAESMGADGLLIVAPYYNKPNQSGLKAHFEAILQASGLPVVLYNIPGRTGINVSSDTVIALAERHANLHAIKDSTGSVDQAGDIAAACRESFRVYSGDDNLTLPFLSVGACGVISVASHIVGQSVSSMMEAYFAGKVDEARKLHYELLPLFQGIFTAPNPTCIKYALAKLGLCKPHLRLPLVPIEGEAKATMDKLMKNVQARASIA